MKEEQIDTSSSPAETATAQEPVPKEAEKFFTEEELDAIRAEQNQIFEKDFSKSIE